jgi:hypothetical protein
LRRKLWLCPLSTDEVTATEAIPSRRLASWAAVRVIVWAWAAPALGPLVA